MNAYARKELAANVTLAIVLALFLAALLSGCSYLDPRAPKMTQMVVDHPLGMSVAAMHQGPAPFWVEPTMSITLTIEDGRTTQTLRIERGAEAGKSVSLFRRVADKATWLLMGIFGRGAV
jgi:cytochrome c556